MSKDRCTVYYTHPKVGGWGGQPFRSAWPFFFLRTSLTILFDFISIADHNVQSRIVVSKQTIYWGKTRKQMILECSNLFNLLRSNNWICCGNFRFSQRLVVKCAVVFVAVPEIKTWSNIFHVAILKPNPCIIITKQKPWLGFGVFLPFLFVDGSTYHMTDGTHAP